MSSALLTARTLAAGDVSRLNFSQIRNFKKVAMAAVVFSALSAAQPAKATLILDTSVGQTGGIYVVNSGQSNGQHFFSGPNTTITSITAFLHAGQYTVGVQGNAVGNKPDDNFIDSQFLTVLSDPFSFSPIGWSNLQTNTNYWFVTESNNGAEDFNVTLPPAVLAYTSGTPGAPWFLTSDNPQKIIIQGSAPTLNPVPEPSSVALLLAGLAGLALLRQERKTNAKSRFYRRTESGRASSPIRVRQ